MMRSRLILAALAISSLSLAGCGVRSALERPAPMFGKQRAAYLAEQERQKAEAAAREAAGQTPPPAPPEQPIPTEPIQAPVPTPPSAPSAVPATPAN